MGSSFKAGLGHARREDHVLTALVDQPGLTQQMVASLLRAHRPGRVTAAAYQNGSGPLHRGHPLLFDAKLRAEASASATGDAGARLFLQVHPELIDLLHHPMSKPQETVCTFRTGRTCALQPLLPFSERRYWTSVKLESVSVGCSSTAYAGPPPTTFPGVAKFGCLVSRGLGDDLVRPHLPSVFLASLVSSRSHRCHCGSS
jgi:hypothetical protein